MRDGYGREIDYLRISVTDKCNLRCRYCMPKDIETVPMAEILTFEEIIETVTAAVSLGINKVRITGGEPLVRRNICSLVRMLKGVSGIEQVTLTTNGVLLERYMGELKQAGIDGINISLDTLDRERYKLLTGYDELDSVLKGLDAALEAGIEVRLDAVSIDWREFLKDRDDKPGDYEDIRTLIGFMKDKPIDVRFIELMPIGCGKDFPGITHDILIPYLKDRFKGMVRDEGKHGNGPAVYYRIPGCEGCIGFISAIHGIFCDECNRIRLTTRGYLKNCLCYDTGEDIKEILRSKLSGQERKELLVSRIKNAILCKPKSHCFINGENISETNPMSMIGG